MAEPLSRWSPFIESSAGLQFGRLCQFYGKWPGDLLLDTNDEPFDLFEQIAIAEALMLRVQVSEVEAEKAQADKAKQDGALQESRTSSTPAASRAVRPPTMEEIQAGITEGRRQ